MQDARIAKICVVTAAFCFLVLCVHPKGRFDENADFPAFDGGEVTHVARSLFEHGTFADPFALGKTGETAVVAPVYPFLVASIARVFGNGKFTSRFMWTMNLLFIAGTFGLLPLLSDELKFGPVPGIISAVLGTVFFQPAITARWELFLVALLFILLFQEHLNPSKNAVYPGLLWGALILTQPMFVVLLAPWLILRGIKRQGPRRQPILIAMIALAVVTPWIVRDYLRFGAFIFVRDGLGLELYTSNNSCAKPSLDENINSGCNALTHPNTTRANAEELARMGEYSYFQDRKIKAIAWIRNNPKRFIKLSAQRFRLFWFSNIVTSLLTLFALPGMWLVYRKNWYAAACLASAWLFFPVLYYFVQYDVRYSFPIYWITLLTASVFLSSLLPKLSQACSAE